MMTGIFSGLVSRVRPFGITVRTPLLLTATRSVWAGLACIDTASGDGRCRTTRANRAGAHEFLKVSAMAVWTFQIIPVLFREDQSGKLIAAVATAILVDRHGLYLASF
ncbi:MAG: hypothetical protein N2Z21_10095 [Candidatus Sumerlaeaceae bacterium]|nr:hypothetical protein [Candidatus Sumerlaeaceae bacterium]